MSSPQTISVLNRLLLNHGRSLPMYFESAVPWTHAGDERAAETLRHIIAAHRRMADRVGELIVAEGGELAHGTFPLRYADLHDLSLDFLIKYLIDRQQRDIASIEWCVDQLRDEPLARALAEEALGEAKGHLDSLSELAAETSGV